MNILITLAMFAAGNVGVREFIDQHDLGAARQDRVHIHFFENGALVFDFLAGHRFHLFGKFFDTLTSVCFDKSDDYVLTTAAPPQCLA